MESKLSSSLEDYLEVIYSLERSNRVARVKDISLSMAVSMPSVVGALKALRDRDLVNYSKNSSITLTEKGTALAVELVWKCTVIRDFLENVLDIPADKAVEQACLMEHCIDSETAESLSRLSVLWEKKSTRSLSDRVLQC